MYEFKCMKYVRNDKFIKLVGKKIQSIRKAQKISQAQLSFESGIRINQVGRIERGEINTSISTLIAIAEALNTHVKELVDVDYRKNK